MVWLSGDGDRQESMSHPPTEVPTAETLVFGDLPSLERRATTRTCRPGSGPTN